MNPKKALYGGPSCDERCPYRVTPKEAVWLTFWLGSRKDFPCQSSEVCSALVDGLSHDRRVLCEGLGVKFFHLQKNRTQGVKGLAFGIRNSS